MSSRRSTRRSGFTVIELAISAALMAMLTGTLVLSLARMSAMETAFEAEVQLQDMGTRAMSRILDRIRGAAYVDANGVSYPHVFDDGDAAPEFDLHDHQPAQSAAEPGDPDFGPNREIVFVLPDDADGNRVPDVDANGEVVWAARESSLVVNTAADGTNVLELRTDAAEPDVLARWVERLTFDTGPNVVGIVPTDPLLPFNSVRVRLWLRLLDGSGRVHTYAAEATTRLRNSSMP